MECSISEFLHFHGVVLSKCLSSYLILFMFFLFQSEHTTLLFRSCRWHFLRSSYLSIAICRSGLWAAVEYDKLCRFYAFFFFASTVTRTCSLLGCLGSSLFRRIHFIIFKLILSLFSIFLRGWLTEALVVVHVPEGEPL